jgi:hypothetical protein
VKVNNIYSEVQEHVELRRAERGDFLRVINMQGKCQEAVLGEREILSRRLPTKAGGKLNSMVRIASLQAQT